MSNLTQFTSATSVGVGGVGRGGGSAGVGEEQSFLSESCPGFMCSPVATSKQDDIPLYTPAVLHKLI